MRVCCVLTVYVIRYIAMNWVLLSLLLLLPAASWCAPKYPDEGIHVHSKGEHLHVNSEEEHLHVNSEEEHLEGIDVQTKQDDLADIEVKVGEEQLNVIDENEVKNLAGIDVKAGNNHLIGIVKDDEDNNLSEVEDDLADIEVKVGEEQLNVIDENEDKNLAGIDVKAGNHRLIGIVKDDKDNNLSELEVKTEEKTFIVDVKQKEELLDEHILNIDVKFEDENSSESIVKLTSEHLSEIDKKTGKEHLVEDKHDAVTTVKLEDKHRKVIDVKSKDQLDETNFNAKNHLTEIDVKSENNHLEGIDEKATDNHLLDTHVKTVKGSPHSGVDVKTEEEQSVKSEEKNLSEINEKAGEEAISNNGTQADNKHVTGMDKATDNHLLDTPVKTNKEVHQSEDVKTEEEHLSQLGVTSKEENLSEINVKAVNAKEHHLLGTDIVTVEEIHRSGVDVKNEEEHLSLLDVESEEDLSKININAEKEDLSENGTKTDEEYITEDGHLSKVDEKKKDEHPSELSVKGEVEKLPNIELQDQDENLVEIDIKVKEVDQKGIDKMIVNIFEPEENDLTEMIVNIFEPEENDLTEMIVNIFEPEENDLTEVEVANQTDLNSLQAQETNPLYPALNETDDKVEKGQFGILMTRLMDMVGIGESGTNLTDIDSTTEEEHFSEIDVKAEEEYSSEIDVNAKEDLSPAEIDIMISKIYMSKYEDLNGSNEMAEQDHLSDIDEKADDQQLTEIDLTIEDEDPTGNDAADEKDSSDLGLVEQSKVFVAKLLDMIGLRNSDESPSKKCNPSSPLYYTDLTDTSCKHFYHCSDGHDPYLQECPTGTRWSPKLHTCDHDENVPCPRTTTDDMSVARCEFKGDGTGEVFGEVVIIQVKDDKNGSHFHGKIIGLSPGLHGFHVHAVGNLSNDCKAAGGHFNPENVTHGRKDDDVRHVGDLGNIEAGEKGDMLVDLWDSVALLNGTHSIIGKAIVVHEGQDDEGSGSNDGSLVHGNAGARAGCCIIEKI